MIEDRAPLQFVTFFYLGDDPAMKALYPQNPQGLTAHNVCVVCDKPFQHGALFFDAGTTGTTIVVADQVCAVLDLDAPRDLAVKLLQARETLNGSTPRPPEPEPEPEPQVRFTIDELPDGAKHHLFGEGSLATKNKTVESIQKLVLATDYITGAEIGCLHKILNGVPGEFPHYTDRTTVQGRIVSSFTEATRYGPIPRMTVEVETLDGTDIAVLWGRCPKHLMDIKRGTTIEFDVADTTPSETDPDRFGFYHLPRGRSTAKVITSP